MTNSMRSLRPLLLGLSYLHVQLAAAARPSFYDTHLIHLGAKQQYLFPVGRSGSEQETQESSHNATWTASTGAPWLDNSDDDALAFFAARSDDEALAYVAARSADDGGAAFLQLLALRGDHAALAFLAATDKTTAFAAPSATSDEGTGPQITFSVDGMTAALDNFTLTVASLSVAGDTPTSSFDFLPPQSVFKTVGYHLGDATFRLRPPGAARHIAVRTAGSAARALPTAPGEYAAAVVDLNPPVPGVDLQRRFVHAPSGGFAIVLTLRNSPDAAGPLEVGSMGFGLPFMTMDVHTGGRSTLDSLAATCSFVDPSIGTGGWASVTRMTGRGGVLLVVPENRTDFQAYRYMSEAQPWYEITSLSKAYAEQEWVNASGKQWVDPSSTIVPAGGSVSFTYRVLLAADVRSKDEALAKAGFPVLQAVPAYTIATDMESAQLHVLPPASDTIRAVVAEPAGAITFGSPARVGAKGFYAVPVRGVAPGRARVTVHYAGGGSSVASYFVLPPLDEHLAAYARFMTSVAWYSNVSDPFGRGLSALAWNRDLKKHIGVGPWDNGYEDNRIFNNGLSDEAGAGANVGLAAAVAGVANASEAAVLDQYLTQTVYGVKKGLPFGASLQCIEGGAAAEQPSCGPASVVGPTADGVMASMFWVPTNSTLEPPMPGYAYDPRWFCGQPGSSVPKCPPGWPGWRWDQARAASLGRAYNYAHVSSCWLAAYQVTRNDQVRLSHNRTWYLERAAKTVVAMPFQAAWYAHQGLMDGTNFRSILEALRDEGMAAEAAAVEEVMRQRTLTGVHNQCRYFVNGSKITDRGADKPGCHWYQAANVTTPWANQTGLPGAGSEFAWDTTGQEEAYVWGAYFAREDPRAQALAAAALDQVLAYTPLVANWAWHGSAYGMGDFSNNGFIRFNNGRERVLQHYRSGLNSIPSTEAFMADPSDLYLVRLAAGSIAGVLANIDAAGAPSMGFHSDPSLLEFDPASGDHGLSVYGMSHNTQSFVVSDPDKGLLCFFCDLQLGGGGGRAGGAASAVVVPRDAYRRRVFVGSLGLQIASDAGRLARVELGLGSGGAVESVRVVFAPVGAQPLSTFRLRLKTTMGGKVFVASAGTMERGAYTIQPGPAVETTIAVTWTG